MLTILLIATMFSVLPIKAVFRGNLNIGIIGSVGSPCWDPNGMKPAAELAADEINAAGGVVLADGGYQIVLKFGNDYGYPSADSAAAAAEVERLITVEGCEYLIGGFRTECLAPMIEKAMDHRIPFIIAGESPSELSRTINRTDPALYDRYKYVFRVSPVNGTVLFRTIARAAQYLITAKLLPLYGHRLYGDVFQVRVAVVLEDSVWAQKMYSYLTNPALYPMVLGKNANVTYAAKIPDGTTDCTPWLQSVKDSGARLLIHAFSRVTGDLFIAQWRAMNVNALPVGINVAGQVQSRWNIMSGACEYETVTADVGTRTPLVPGVTTVFWDKFVNKTGVWPVYTAFGAYDAMNLLKDGLKAIGSEDKDQLVAYWENPAFQAMTTLGNFRFDSSHDVFCNEDGPNWTQGYVRPFMVQWQAGRMEVVCPVDQVYSTKWVIPPWMYPLKVDMNYDGKVDILDIAACAKAFTIFGTKPGDPKWDKEVDLNLDGQINIIDITLIAKDFGKSVTLPLP